MTVRVDPGFSARDPGSGADAAAHSVDEAGGKAIHLVMRGGGIHHDFIISPDE